MIHISSSAYIFYISGKEVANNSLQACRERIIETFENTEAVSNDRPLIYIFIEQPPYRWEQEVKRQMELLEEHFEPEVLVHSFIFPIHAYKTMFDKHSGDATDER